MKIFVTSILFLLSFSCVQAATPKDEFCKKPDGIIESANGFTIAHPLLNKKDIHIGIGTILKRDGFLYYSLEIDKRLSTTVTMEETEIYRYSCTKKTGERLWSGKGIFWVNTVALDGKWLLLRDLGTHGNYAFLDLVNMKQSRRLKISELAGSELVTKDFKKYYKQSVKSSFPWISPLFIDRLKNDATLVSFELKEKPELSNSASRIIQCPYAIDIPSWKLTHKIPLKNLKAQRPLSVYEVYCK